MSHSGWTHVDAIRIERETDAAFLIRFEDGTHWIPKSQLSEPDRLEVGDEDVTVTMTDWIAEQKGLSES